MSRMLVDLAILLILYLHCCGTPETKVAAVLVVD
jgi:hypothetical protein